MVTDYSVSIDIVMLATRMTWLGILRVPTVEGIRPLVLRVGGGDARLLAPRAPEFGDESQIERERAVDSVVNVMSVFDKVMDGAEHCTGQSVKLLNEH